jgi:CO dehydrogenase/acetyl-CoA synthase alpha subunit
VPPAVHKIRASECGNAKTAERFTTVWAETTCPTCLRHLPAPLRVPTAAIRRCVDGRCEDDLTCLLCNRCPSHCDAKAPNDVAAHQTWEAAWAKTIRSSKKRRR